jgi:hypothetical protein
MKSNQICYFNQYDRSYKRMHERFRKTLFYAIKLKICRRISQIKNFDPKMPYFLLENDHPEKNKYHIRNQRQKMSYM